MPVLSEGVLSTLPIIHTREDLFLHGYRIAASEFYSKVYALDCTLARPATV